VNTRQEHGNAGYVQLNITGTPPDLGIRWTSAQ
jgi:hypothetical protein